MAKCQIDRQDSQHNQTGRTDTWADRLKEWRVILSDRCVVKPAPYRGGGLCVPSPGLAAWLTVEYHRRWPSGKRECRTGRVQSPRASRTPALCSTYWRASSGLCHGEEKSTDSHWAETRTEFNLRNRSNVSQNELIHSSLCTFQLLYNFIADHLPNKYIVDFQFSIHYPYHPGSCSFEFMLVKHEWDGESITSVHWISAVFLHFKQTRTREENHVHFADYFQVETAHECSIMPHIPQPVDSRGCQCSSTISLWLTKIWPLDSMVIMQANKSWGRQYSLPLLQEIFNTHIRCVSITVFLYRVFPEWDNLAPAVALKPPLLNSPSSGSWPWAGLPDWLRRILGTTKTLMMSVWRENGKRERDWDNVATWQQNKKILLMLLLTTLLYVHIYIYISSKLTSPRVF